MIPRSPQFHRQAGVKKHVSVESSDYLISEHTDSILNGPLQVVSVANTHCIPVVIDRCVFLPLTMNPVDGGDVGHAVFIGFSALRRRFGQGKTRAGSPPGFPSSLRCAEEVSASLTPATFAGLSMKVSLFSQPGMVKCKTIAKGPTVRVLSVGTGDIVMLGGWPFSGVH